MMGRIFEYSIKADRGSGYRNYGIEEMYQEFKKRLIEELVVVSNELLDDAELIDNEHID